MMTIEQKAKAYDEALEKAKNYHSPETVCNVRIAMENLFPELKESEDERIRKEIIIYLKSILSNKKYGDKFIERWIAWLEKQGEQKSTDVDNKFIRMRETKPKDISEFLNRLTTVEQEFLCEHIEKVKKLDREEREQKPTPIFRIGDTIIAKDGTYIEKEPFHIDKIEDDCYWDGENTILVCNQDEFEIFKQKSVNKVEPKFHEGDIIRHKEQGFTCKIIAIDTEYRLSGCNGTHLPFDSQDAYELVEQKPADKVESKFKVKKGEWYVCTNTFVSKGKIIAIKGQTYQSKQEDDTITCEDNCLFIDRHDGKASDYFRSWTIQDAKEGDVLVNWNNNIYLFKGIEEEVVKFYCYYNTNREEFNTPFNNNSHLGLTEPQFGHHPATKEQRDLLFTKMKEAGYEWDADKKELRKVEEKPAEEWYDFIRWFVKQRTDGYTLIPSDDDIHKWGDNILNHARKFLDKQKPAWSEEDESWFKELELMALSFSNDDSYRKKFFDWRKSIKERVQPQSYWKPSDEQIEALEHFVRSIGESGYASPYDNNTKLLYLLLSDLKKLKG